LRGTETTTRVIDTPTAWVGAALLVALVGGIAGVVGLSGTATGAATASAPASATAPAAHVVAVDVVRPQPVDIVFARPVAPARKAAPARQAQPAVQVRAARPAATVTRATRTRPATSADCTGEGWQQRRGENALRSLQHPVPAGVTVAFLPGRGALKGMTYYDRHHVDVFVQSCASESDSLLRHVVAHEMGHAWDSLHMTADLRAAYLEARGIAAGTPWFGCSECQDFATPAGDFAETYAQWQRGASDSRTTIARPASPAELADLGARFFS
jgi:hypothetical protein